jgi:chromosome partitioning protein
VAEGYDLVIVDCPPRAGDVQRSALMVATLALLPCGPAAPDAWALASSLDVVREAQTLRPELVAAVLVTRKQGRTAIGKGARDVLEQSGLPVLRAELGYRVAYQEALAAGQGATGYEPLSEAANEVRALFGEVIAMVEGAAGKKPSAKRKRAAPAAGKGKTRGR